MVRYTLKILQHLLRDFLKCAWSFWDFVHQKVSEVLFFFFSNSFDYQLYNALLWFGQIFYDAFRHKYNTFAISNHVFEKHLFIKPLKEIQQTLEINWMFVRRWFMQEPSPYEKFLFIDKPLIVTYRGEKS